MNNYLRKVALGAAVLLSASAYAQTDGPTIVQNWITSEGISADANVRSGNGVNGKVYVTNTTKFVEIDGSLPAGQQTKTIYTAPTSMNKGVYTDDAGNSVVFTTFSGAAAYKNAYLIKPDGTAKTISLSAPEGSTWAGGRSDNAHRAVGDFFSEEGGVFFITASDCQYPIPVYIKNGEVQTLSGETAARFAAANSCASAIPSFESMADFDAATVKDKFYYYSGSAKWNIGYVGADGKAAYLKQPTKFVNGFSAQTQNGFEVFTLGDHTYTIRMADTGTWGANFIIYDENGEITFSTNYQSPYGGIKTPGNGSAVVARKVNPYKVEIYQMFSRSSSTGGFAAMYTMTIPEPEAPVAPLYITGDFNGWNPADPAKFTYANGLYTYDLDLQSGGFKISTVAGEWPEFNAGALWVEGNTIITGNTYPLQKGGDPGNYVMNPGKYTLTVDLDAMTLSVSGTPYEFVAPALYLRGDFDWTEGLKFTTDNTLADDGYVDYTLFVPSLSGEFKITDGTNWWGHDTEAITAPGDYEFYTSHNNAKLESKLTNVSLTVRLAVDITKPMLVNIDGKAFGSRHAHAYGIYAAPSNNNIYDIEYNSTADAVGAELMLTPVIEGELAPQSEATVIPLPAPVKGKNSASVSLIDLPTGKYNWAVRIINNHEAETPELVYEAPLSWMRNTKSSGGAVWIRDTESPAYGYSIAGYGNAGGYAVYDPEGELLYGGLIHADTKGFVKDNGSSTGRGDSYKGKAVFADWSDSNAGLFVIDPLDPQAAPVNMMMPEGATRAADGTISYNGTAIGSGSPTVAFQGTGEDTKMFTFDEDIYKNAIVRYDLGDADFLTTAPTFDLADVKGRHINTNIEIEPVTNGFFVTQVRADFAGGVPGLEYYDNEGNRKYTSIGATGDAILMPSTCAGLAVNRAENLMALAAYDGMIGIFELSFSDDNVPSFVKKYQFQVPNRKGNLNWAQLTFDDANNLHIFHRRAGGYLVYKLPGEHIAHTAAPANNVLAVITGVEGVTVGQEEAPVEFYNLQGVRVDGDNLTPGIYIRRQGNTSKKIMVK